MAHHFPGAVHRFLDDRRASVTVEFVIALPVLLAMLAFSVQYGNALKVRNNRDIASRDAARFLARAPLNPAGTAVDQIFITKAQAIVSARMANTKATISGFTAASDATSATINVTIDVPFPLISFIGLFEGTEPTLAMTANENWVRSGDMIVTSSSTGGV